MGVEDDTAANSSGARSRPPQQGLPSQHGQPQIPQERYRDRSRVEQPDAESGPEYAAAATTGGESQYRRSGLEPDGADRTSGPGAAGGTYSEVGAARGDGTLPDPSEFAGYDRVLPGAADRILSMAEAANEVQNAAVERATEAEVKYARNGQFIGLALTLMAFIASIVFFAVGNQLAGVIFVVIPIVMLLRSPGRGPSEED